MEIRTYTAEQEVELLNREESHFLDFKRASITPGKLQETVVALANADGGEVPRGHGVLEGERRGRWVTRRALDREGPVGTTPREERIAIRAHGHDARHMRQRLEDGAYSLIVRGEIAALPTRRLGATLQ